jgi:hypothetical protein
MAFSEEKIWQIWDKAYQITISDAPMWRKDECGAWIRRIDYENPGSQYGWVADYITPESEGGSDDISNLRPLQWENILRKKDGSLECPVIASGTENVKRDKSMRNFNNFD